MRAVTAERVARLFRLVAILARAPIARSALLRKLGMNQRSFYRDLEFLRAIGIAVTAEDSRYALTIDYESALARLPFPDPHLTLGQAMVLARGRSSAHKTLRARVDAIVKPPSRGKS